MAQPVRGRFRRGADESAFHEVIIRYYNTCVNSVIKSFFFFLQLYLSFFFLLRQMGHYDFSVSYQSLYVIIYIILCVESLLLKSGKIRGLFILFSTEH